jgi:hypothetical protein
MMNHIRNEKSGPCDVSLNVIACHLPELEKASDRTLYRSCKKEERELLATDSGPDKRFCKTETEMRCVYIINTSTLQTTQLFNHWKDT